MARKRKADEYELSDDALKNYIAELNAVLSEKYTQRNTNIELIRSYRMMRQEVDIPDAYRKNVTVYRSPIIYDYLRRAAAIFGDEYPQPKVLPAKPGVSAQAKSSLIEKWLMAFYQYMNRKRPLLPYLKDAIVADGAAVWKILLDWHAWGDIPTKDKGEKAETYNRRVSQARQGVIPIKWEPIRPETFYPVYGIDGLEEALEVSKRELLPLVRKYGLKTDYNSRLSRYGEKLPNAKETCDFIEWFNGEEFAYLVDGEIIRRGKHNYGRVPYFEAHATTTSSTLPEDQWLSFAHPILPLVAQVDTLVTVFQNWGIITAFPIPHLEATGELALSTTYDSTFKFELQPGQGFRDIPGYKVSFLQPPPIGTTLANFLEYLSREVDKLVLAPVLQGIVAGEMSGVMGAMMVSVAKSMFGPAVRNLESAFDEAAIFVLHLIKDVLKDSVAILSNGGKDSEWVEIGPDDIEGWVQHSLQPVIPAEAQINFMNTAAAVGQGLAARREAVEARGHHNPEEILEEIQREEIMNMPQVLNLMMSKVLRQLGQGETPVQPLGTPATPPVGPGGFGIPAVAGVQRPLPPTGGP